MMNFLTYTSIILILFSCKEVVKPINKPININTKYLTNEIDFNIGGWSLGNNCSQRTYWQKNGVLDLKGDTLELINAELTILKLKNNGNTVSKNDMLLTGQLKLKCNSKIFIGMYY